MCVRDWARGAREGERKGESGGGRVRVEGVVHLLFPETTRVHIHTHTTHMRIHIHTYTHTHIHTHTHRKKIEYHCVVCQQFLLP